MSQKIKKFIRSIQVFFPGIVEIRSWIEDTYYRISGELFCVDFGGLKRLNLDNALIVDVGAHRGQCVRAFRNAAPRAKVIAVEPVPALASKLAERYANDPSVQVEHCALSDHQGSGTINVPTYRGYLFDGMSTLDATKAASAMNARRFNWFNPAQAAVQSYPVPLRTLDSYGLAPTILKLHAQRAEISILKGSTNTIRDHHPIIMCAWVWDDESNYLSTLGYVPHAFRDGRFVPNAFGAEFTWFFRPEHAALIGG